MAVPRRHSSNTNQFLWSRTTVAGQNSTPPDCPDNLEAIILTGHGSVDSAVECTKLGAFGYLPKPYKLEELLEVLKQAYEARMKKKFEQDAARMEKIAQLATGSSALGILRELRQLDDEEK